MGKGNKRILITGINGFVGSHLSEYVLDNKLGELYGTVRGKHANLENIERIRERVNLIQCDITDSYAVGKTIGEVMPDFIFHLAAQAFVPASWRSPVETLNTNIMGSMNLFEAVRNSGCGALVQIAGSSEEYGFVKPDEVPIKETNPLRPLSPYGVSKAAMDMLGWQYYKSYGLKIIRTRAFNHTGPRRGEVYVCSDWSKQIVEIEAGKRKPVLYVGNLDAKRDFTDVRDTVRAYWLLAENGEHGEVYNICSGKSIQVRKILEMLLSMSDAKIEVRQDPKKMRPSDVPVLEGDCTRLSALTGWKREIEFEKTLKDLLEYWRAKVGK